jgi:hypothetical protein
MFKIKFRSQAEVGDVVCWQDDVDPSCVIMGIVQAKTYRRELQEQKGWDPPIFVSVDTYDVIIADDIIKYLADTVVTCNKLKCSYESIKENCRNVILSTSLLKRRDVDRDKCVVRYKFSDIVRAPDLECDETHVMNIPLGRMEWRKSHNLGRVGNDCIALLQARGLWKDHV